MAHEAERRMAHDRKYRGQGDFSAQRSATHEADEQDEERHSQQGDEHEQRVTHPAELEVGPAGACPFIPRGAQRDQDVLQARHGPGTRDP